MAEEEYTIRLMEEKDIGPIAKMFETLGRIPVGLNEVMLRTDWNTSPQGCVVAVNSAGQIICQCCTVAVDDKEAYLVFYRTEEGYRGKGIGSKVFRASFDAVQPRNVALTSREPMTSKYLKSDFRCYGFGIYNLVFARNPGKPDTQGHDGKQEIQEDSGICELKRVDDAMHKDVYKYLNSTVKMPEKEFYEVFLKVSSHVTAAIKDGAVVGFGALQQTPVEVRVTPVYADNQQVAQRLLARLLAGVPDRRLATVPLPDNQRAHVQREVENLGFTLQSEAFIDKIYSQRKVALNLERVYSFWNFESVYQ